MWPDVQQLRRVDDQTMRAQATGQGSANKSWLEIFKRSTNSLKSTICIDTGRGNAKYARADDWRPDHINLGAYGLVPTSLEASHRIDLLLELVLGRVQRLHKREARTGWKMTLAVPFRLAAASDAAEREEWQ